MKTDILQIMPVKGWKAVFEVNGKPAFEKIVCLALIKETEIDGYEFTSVQGMTCCEWIDTVESVSNFIGYKIPGQRINWKKEAKEQAKIKNEIAKKDSEKNNTVIKGGLI